MIFLINLKYYKKITKQKVDHKESVKNILLSFLFGGLICVLAEGILKLFLLGFDMETSRILTSLVIIFLGSFLTGLGLYDNIGRYAHSGTIIPISGFANTTTSSAMDHKHEGFFMGICANLLKLSGIVISIAAIFGVLFGILKYWWFK